MDLPILRCLALNIETHATQIETLYSHALLPIEQLPTPYRQDCLNHLLIKRKHEVPALGLVIVKEMLTLSMHRRLFWCKEHYTQNTFLREGILKDFVRPTHYNAIIELTDRISDILYDLDLSIAGFITNHEWGLHSLKITSTDMIIESSIDYRAYCWEQEHGETFRLCIQNKKPNRS